MSDDQEQLVAYNMQPFRRAVFRGLGLVLAPLLTIVILLWIGSSVQKFVLNPVEWSSRRAAVWFMNETLEDVPDGIVPIEPMTDAETAVENENDVQPTATESSEIRQLIDTVERLERRLIENSPEDSLVVQRMDERRFNYESKIFVQLPNGEWIPEHVRDSVNEHVRATGVPLARASGKGYYEHYVEYLVLKKSFVIPVFLAGFILLMYLLGKFLAAGVGRIFWNAMESVINQLPIIRTVYSSVKQVTDFFVGESDIDFQRVVAVQYPSKGIWSLGFVTGNSIRQLTDATGEPMLSVLMPTSPMPMTGFTVTVRRSDTIDVDMTVDEAIQFVVSCGVVVPPGQRIVRTNADEAKRPKAKYRDGAVVLPSSTPTESDPSTV